MRDSDRLALAIERFGDILDEVRRVRHYVHSHGMDQYHKLVEACIRMEAALGQPVTPRGLYDAADLEAVRAMTK